MSDKERATALLEYVPPYKMGYVLAYLQGLTADEEVDIPNAETIASMGEVKEMIRTGSGEHWQGSTANLVASILAGDD